MQLKISEDGQNSRLQSFTSARVLVGRAADCDVVLTQSYVSGRHMVLHDGLVVEDLGSRNGTFLDDRQVTGREVILGRRLTLGGPTLMIEVLHDEAETSGVVAQEVLRLRRRIAELERAGAGSRGSSPDLALAPTMPPAGSTAATGVASDADALSLLRELVAHDHSGFPTRLTGPISDFYLLESFKFLRKVETIVTRLAGGLTNQFGLQTKLPDMQENLRDAMSSILQGQDDRESRDLLVKYLERLVEWLNLAFDAYRDASFDFAKELKDSTRPGVLRQEGPIPRRFRAAGLEELVLWRRSQAFFEQLSDRYVTDRLESLARNSVMQSLDDLDDAF